MALAVVSKALDEMTVERDAALVAKEDLLAQVRVAKRRLQDAEDEQYRAEQDAASLRAEIQSMQQMDAGPSFMTSHSSDQREMASMKVELEETWQRLQQEQLKLATEQSRNAELIAKLKEAERVAKDSQTSQQTSEAESAEVGSPSVTLPFTGTSSPVDIAAYASKNSKQEAQLHELATMVERLENGRQKLLGEIDSQSAEIERLFVENANLTSSVEETADLITQLEKQVEQCLEHNAQLRSETNILRMEQAKSSTLEERVSFGRSSEVSQRAFGDGANAVEALRKETSNLKVQLAQSQSREVDQTAQIAQLSANLNRAVLASNRLGRIYVPVLANFENRLLQLKQRVPVSDGLRY